MSSRKRTLRTNPTRRQRRSLPRLLENLEPRLVLSKISIPLGPVAPVGSGTLSNITAPPERQGYGTPDYKVAFELTPDGGLTPDQSSAPVGYTPQQLQDAYGVNLLTFGSIPGDGAGITIAVIDAGNNTGFEPTGPKYAGSVAPGIRQHVWLARPTQFPDVQSDGWDDAS